MHRHLLLPNEVLQDGDLLTLESCGGGVMALSACS
jgi:hypothetical protein